MPSLAPIHQLLLLAATTCALSATEVIQPYGLFADAGALDTAVVNHPQSRGNLIRVFWKDLEPTAGNFAWAQIDNQLSLVRAAGKSWSLAVSAGSNAPSWLYALPYQIPSMAISFRGSPATVPLFWDAQLQERLRLLAVALANRYGSDPTLALVYLPQMSANGIEGHFNGTTGNTGAYPGGSPPSLTSQGFTVDLWVQAVLQGTRTFVDAFPDKPIAVELHNLLDSPIAGQRIMDGITADATLAGHVGVAIWWLSGKTDYQSELLDSMDSFPGAVYAQLIDKSANSASFLNNTYLEAFTQAQAMGIRYVEPWDIDFTSGIWDSAFADFNADAAPKVILTAIPASLAESTGTATLTATLSAAITQTVTVTLSTGGTATIGTDYTLSSTTISIPAGSTIGTATIATLPDTQAEGDETIAIDIASVTNAAEDGIQHMLLLVVDDPGSQSGTESAATTAQGAGGCGAGALIGALALTMGLALRTRSVIRRRDDVVENRYTMNSSIPLSDTRIMDFVLLLCLIHHMPGAEPITPPRGIFASAGSREAAVVDHPHNRGCLIRVPWSELEPTRGRFDLDRIRNQTALLRTARKGWSLAVVAGPSSPNWLYAAPDAITSLDITFRGRAVRVPQFWHPALQQRLAVLAQALGTAFRDDPGLSLVYVPQMSANGIEGHFNGNSPQILMDQGVTRAHWAPAVLSGARMLCEAFPRTPIAIELHDLLGSTEIPGDIMQAIAADPALLRQVGVAIWWLSGRTTYQGGLLNALTSFPGAKYGQLIDRSDHGDAFPPGGFAEAFAQARSLGIRYLEPWEVDVKSNHWNELLADFNRWANEDH